MAEIINCPACRRTLQVPASFSGQTVQCPECRHEFAAGQPETSAVQSDPPPAPPAPRDEEPRRRRRRDRDEDFDDDDDTSYLRQSSRPHRGGMILAMGLIALMLFPYATIVCGPMAWVMGNTDLAEIRAGRMDPSGEGMVQAGRILGIIATIMMAIGVVAFFAMIGFLVTVG